MAKSGGDMSRTASSIYVAIYLSFYFKRPSAQRTRPSPEWEAAGGVVAREVMEKLLFKHPVCCWLLVAVKITL